MALVLKDRVRETSTTSGTGTIVLAGAVAGFQSFSAIGNANTTYYCIADSSTGGWEVGIGTYTSSGTTLSRTTVLASSNSGALVAFSANVKDVFCTYPAGKSANTNAALTSGRVTFATTDGLLTDSAGLTFDGTNFTTTGTATAAKLIPTGTSVTGNGMYLPATNSVGISTAGTNAVYIDASQNVGIGTSSPTSILNVKSASPIFRLETTGTVSSGGVAYNSIRDSTGSDVFINGFAGLANCYQFSTTAAAGFIRFLTGASVEAMRIDSSGNVGIGTSAPANKFEVSSANNIIYSTGTAGFGSFYARGSGTNNSYIFMGNATSGEQGRITVENGGAIVFSNTVSATDRMRIDSSGNVGIGLTPTGDGLLEIYGPSSATIYKNVNTGTGSSDGFYVGMAKSSGTDGYVYNRESGNLIFGTVNAERARIDTSGNLLVGATSALSNARAIVYSNSAGNAPFEARNLQTSAGKYWFFGPNTSNAYVIGNQSAVGVQVTDGATSWSSLSDERSKTNLKKIENGIKKVVSLRAVTGRYIKDKDSASRAFLIAQDVLQVLPEAVDQTNPDELSLRYTEVIPLLTAAIQEQQILIDSLTTRLTALEQK